MSQRLIFLAIAVFCSFNVLSGQEKPLDRAALSAALKGSVEAFEDGVLTLRYAFEQPDELDDFPAQGFDPTSLRIEDGHLHISKPEDDEQGAFMKLGPIGFKAPWSLRFKMTPAFKDSGLIIGLSDTVGRKGQTWVLLNAPLGGRKDERMFAAFRTIPGAGGSPVAGPRTLPVVAEKSVNVELTVRDGELSVSFAGRRILHDPFFSHESFELAIGPASTSGVEIDDLRVWGKTLPASVRKLVLGSKAEESDEARRLEEGQTAGIATTMARIQEPLSRAVRREVRELDDEARALFIRARDREGARDFEDAALLLQEASLHAPDAAIVYWRAGWNLQFSGQHRLAEKALRRAIELDDELAVAWRDLGAICSLLERDDEALEAYDQAIDLDPDNAVAYALKGQVLQGQGRLDDALALYEEARDLKPDTQAWVLLVEGIKRLKKPPQWKKSWRETTEHFEVLTNVSEPFAKRVAGRLEIYREFLERLIPLPEGQSDERSRVWIFDARGEYNVFAGTLMSRTAEHTAGVYHPAIRTLLLFDDVDRESTFDTLYHEAFHQYLDRVNRSTPIWFNEGMAEFFGAVQIADGRVRGLGIHHERLLELRRALREAPERIRDLDEFVQMPKVEFYDGDEASLHYAVAWSLCHFFMTGRNAEASATFRAYAAAIIEGKSGKEAYAASFGADGGRKAESFRRAWLRHVRRF